MSSTHTCRLMIDQLLNDEWFAVEMNPSTPFDLGDPSRARGVLSDVRSVYLVIRHFNVRASSRLAGARRLSLLALCTFCSPSGRKNGKHASSTRRRKGDGRRQRKTDLSKVVWTRLKESTSRDQLVQLASSCILNR